MNSGTESPKKSTRNYYKFITKLWPFFLTRLCPIFILWTGVVCVYGIATLTLDNLKDKGGDALRTGLNFNLFLDGTMVFTIFFGAILAIAFFTILFMNLNTEQSDNNNLSEFNCRIIDEVSSASTHVSFAILASFFIPAGNTHNIETPLSHRILSFVAYLLIGFWFFYGPPKKQENSDESAPT